jgi:hypothetical protein
MKMAKTGWLICPSGAKYLSADCCWHCLKFRFVKLNFDWCEVFCVWQIGNISLWLLTIRSKLLYSTRSLDWETPLQYITYIRYTNQSLVSRNGISSNVNELGEINDNISIYDEINDLDLYEFHEMHTANNLNHKIAKSCYIVHDPLIGKRPYNT